MRTVKSQLFEPCRTQGLNLGHQAWQQESLPTKSPYCPKNTNKCLWYKYYLNFSIEFIIISDLNQSSKTR